MEALLSLIPIGVTLGLMLKLKRSPVVSCAAGMAAALVLARSVESFGLTTTSAATAAASTAYLGLSVALVILPGLYLMQVIRAQGAVDGLAAWIEELPLDPAAKVLLLLLGVVPAIESLTGFGISLLLAVPVLFRLAEPRAAHRLSLLGMNIMPWGTLALATLVGATLIAEPAAKLGMASALTSAPVFPLLGLVSLHVLGGRTAMARWSWLALFMGCVLPLCLFLAARYATVEIAGVAAGLVTAALSVALLRATGRLGPASGRGVMRFFAPYLLVLALIVARRSIPALWHELSTTFVLRNTRVTLAPLTSPGLCLLLAAVLLRLKKPATVDLRALLRRAQKPIAATLAFLALAQVMREAGMLDAIARAVAQLDGWILWLLVPAVGMLSGFATGSNVGGNVLLINLEHEVGANHGQGLLFAAMHSSAAGHAVFASLPIIMLLLAVAGELERPKETDVTPDALLRFALLVALLLLGALSLGFALLSHFDLVDRLV
ncbi:L-lactate permease [Polyangium fumosum]|uniref:L-lactate permease n=1 Tax=Polyangium fumosum TaxID=889272 RepID=A0A4U1JEC4_9BACT|nr:L-lactate permease [Polyangium fumosum]TKD09434.1 hypothetical protein E8A74_11960 [Polyangium fumosum]